jgi:hypothetical protein
VYKPGARLGVSPPSMLAATQAGDRAGDLGADGVGGCIHVRLGIHRDGGLAAMMMMMMMMMRRRRRRRRMMMMMMITLLLL